MSSIIDDKNKTIYVIKESVGGEIKVSIIIEKIILKDIKNNVISKEEVKGTKTLEDIIKDLIGKSLKLGCNKEKQEKFFEIYFRK